MKNVIKLIIILIYNFSYSQNVTNYIGNEYFNIKINSISLNEIFNTPGNIDELNSLFNTTGERSYQAPSFQYKALGVQLVYSDWHPDHNGLVNIKYLGTPGSLNICGIEIKIGSNMSLLSEYSLNIRNNGLRAYLFQPEPQWEESAITIIIDENNLVSEIEYYILL